MSQALGDIDRRLGNVLRYGTVVSLYGRRVVVKLDDNTTTPPLQWFAARAGKNRDWNPPEAGEQVMILSPSGELSRGTVLPAIFQDTHPENGDDGNTTRRTYEDGTVVEYDRAGHQLLVDTSASNGSVVVNCGSGNVTVNCNQATVKADDKVTLDTPNTYCTGNLFVAMNFTMGTTAGSNATMTFNNATMNGNSLNMNIGAIAMAGGSLTHNGKNVGSTHQHSGVSSGSSNTAAPI